MKKRPAQMLIGSIMLGLVVFIVTVSTWGPAVDRWTPGRVEAAQTGMGPGVFSTGRCGTTAFTRRAPSLCVHSITGSDYISVTITNVSTCTGILLTANPIRPVARVLNMTARFLFTGGTVEGAAIMVGRFYSDSACTVLLPTGGLVNDFLTSYVFLPSTQNGALLYSISFPLLIFSNSGTVYTQLTTKTMPAGATATMSLYGPSSYND